MDFGVDCVAGLGACVSLHCKHKGVFGWSIAIPQCFPLTCALPQLLSLSKETSHAETRRVNFIWGFKPLSAMMCLSYCDSVLNTGRSAGCRTPLRSWEEFKIYGMRLFSIINKKSVLGSSDVKTLMSLCKLHKHLNGTG